MSEVNDKTDCKNVAQISTTHDDYFEKLGIAAESKYKQLGVLFNIILKHIFKCTTIKHCFCYLNVKT